MSIELTAFLSFILMLYMAYMIVLSQYWAEYKHENDSLNYTPRTFVSILIPFRNEQDNLPRLIEGLSELNYPKEFLNIYFINDHSTDGGEILIVNEIEKQNNFHLLQSQGEGKKNALKTGIINSEEELIITIDADVQVHPNWLKRIVSAYEQTQSDMIILPVMQDSNSSIIQKILQTEFIALAGITGASALSNNAVMCNGANLCFTRETYVKVESRIQHTDFSSGDDTFLLLAIKKDKSKNIKYLFHKEVVAHTSPPNTISAFFSQRIRWASKTHAVRDKATLFTGISILAANLSILIIFLLVVFGKIPFGILILAFGLKVFVDGTFIRRVGNSFVKKPSWGIIILLSGLYPIYTLLIPILSFVIRPKWKGRTISLGANKSNRG